MTTRSWFLRSSWLSFPCRRLSLRGTSGAWIVSPMDTTHTAEQPTALDMARAKVAEMRANGIAPERLTPIERAKRNPKSLRAAITAKCWDCVCGDADPRPRERIAECASKTCPLVTLRPYQKRSGK